MGVLSVGAADDVQSVDRGSVLVGAIWGGVGWARRVKYKFVPFVYQEDRLFACAKFPFFLPSFGANFDNRVTTR